MFTKKLRAFLLLIPVLMSQVTVNGSSTLLPSSQDVAQVEVNRLVATRELARGSVLDIKQKYKPTDKEYGEAKQLYRVAHAKVTGWISVVTLAIKKGNTKDLRKDKQYLEISKEAGNAIQAFLKYEEHNLGETKGVFSFLNAMIDAGLKIWNEWRERQAKERERYAESFQKEAKWDRWEDIKVDGQKP
jgi:hypothetical protein